MLASVTNHNKDKEKVIGLQDEQDSKDNSADNSTDVASELLTDVLENYPITFFFNSNFKDFFKPHVSSEMLIGHDARGWYVTPNQLFEIMKSQTVVPCTGSF